MKMLVACEYSGIVRRAFAARGHDAWSCDLLPAKERSRFFTGIAEAMADQWGGGDVGGGGCWTIRATYPRDIRRGL